MDNIKGISLINNISKYLYIFASTISIIFVCILFYILIGGSFEGLINVDTIINDSESSSQYSNFNQVPLGSRFIGFLLAVLIIGFTLTILKFWKNFISLVNQGKYFEVSTLKNPVSNEKVSLAKVPLLFIYSHNKIIFRKIQLLLDIEHWI